MLWCAVRAGDEIAAGTSCRGDKNGGGRVDTLFTRRPWRKQGVGAGLLGDAFGRFWARGEHSVGSAPRRRATAAPSASTSARGWRLPSAGRSTRRSSAMLREFRAGEPGFQGDGHLTLCDELPNRLCLSPICHPRLGFPRRKPGTPGNSTAATFRFCSSRIGDASARQVFAPAVLSVAGPGRACVSGAAGRYRGSNG